MVDTALIDELRSRISSYEASGKQSRPNSAQLDSDKGAASESGEAFKKIVALVNVSDRSERSVRDRLIKSGFSECAVDEAVARAKDYGFIDDKRYAEVLVRSRLSQGRGSAGIIRELETHDIDIDIVEGWPYAFGVDDETELSRALEFLKRKPPRAKNARDGAYRKLVTKGYSSSTASRAARIWSDGR